ncbi:MAG TPA: hypothetical protein VFD80_08880 [Flavobacteriaceae bacterium]|nr:hypothetical protein [Flavobacteriaceae bacterium]
MKKVLVLAIALIGFNAISQAQETDLSVVVGEDVMSIEVTHPTVTIQMNTPQHFTDGNDTGVLDDHLVVTSNVGYKIEVIADGVNFTPASGTDQIAVSNVTVEVTGAGNNVTSTATLPGAVALSDSAIEILTTDGGDINREYPVRYAVPSANAGSFLNVEPTTYTTTLTYSVAPL